MVFATLQSVALVACTVVAYFTSFPQVKAQNFAAFDWNSITPSTNLTWVTCYSPATQCTRFSVPLNYSDPSAGSVSLALIRIPSPLGLAGSPSYRGPVLLNPGGPGGSGVDALLSFGNVIASRVLGEEFDLVSFDPRGVKHSTPPISFFTSDIERASFDFGPNVADVDVGPNATTSLPEQWALVQVLGRLAKDRDNGVLAHVTTDNVARDMLRIVQAHGRERLMYWGFSYGTVLGATFAAMFPDKVERLVLDGVLDMEGYYAVDWANGVLDADAALKVFFSSCAAAGPSSCAFHSPTASAIEQRLSSLYARVLSQPIPAYSPSLTKYGVVNHPTLKNAIFTAMYTPYTSFAKLAKGLKDLEDGDGSALFQLSVALGSEALAAIACADGAPVEDDAEALAQYAQRKSGLSSFSSVEAGIRLLCSGWKIHPNSFKGPISGNTSFPLLLIGNTADPATPLAMAKKTALGFPGSVVLTQDSPGHTSLTSPSPCTLGHVQQYFQNGTLPSEGVVCPVPASLFPAPSNMPVPARRSARGHSTRMSEIGEALRADKIGPFAI